MADAFSPESRCAEEISKRSSMLSKMPSTLDLNAELRKLSVARSEIEVGELVRDATERLVRPDWTSFLIIEGRVSDRTAECVPGHPPCMPSGVFCVSCASQALVSHSVVTISDVLTDDRTTPMFQRSSFRGVLLVPACSNDLSVVLGAYWKEPRDPDLEQVAILATLTRNASAAVRCIRLFAMFADKRSALNCPP